ncbi:SGNH/GDSL hydrolase family protein [Propionibacteriaceae bacterium Y2011]
MVSKNALTAAGLGLLAFVTAILVGFAMLHGRGTGPGSAVPQPPPPSATGPVGTSTGSSGSPSAAGTPGPSTSSPAGPSSSAGSESSPTAGSGNSADEIKALLRGSEPVTVLVVGDESGAGSSLWVRKWADDIAEQRPVAYQQWDGDGFGSAQKLGEGSGGVVTIRNASISDATAESLAELADDLLDEAPDVVIINLAAHEDPDDVPADMTALWEALGSDALGAVVLQNSHKQGNPSQQVDNVSAMRAWAVEAKLPTVDVYGAFAHDSAPLATLLDGQGQLPNAAGVRLWVFTVQSAIGP